MLVAFLGTLILLAVAGLLAYGELLLKKHFGPLKRKPDATQLELQFPPEEYYIRTSLDDIDELVVVSISPNSRVIAPEELNKLDLDSIVEEPWTEQGRDPRKKLNQLKCLFPWLK